MKERDQQLNIICLESQAFYAILDAVMERFDRKQSQSDYNWIDEKEAKRMLGGSSRTTLQKYRDEGKIRFTQPSRRVILYDRQSILDFLDANAKDTF